MKLALILAVVHVAISGAMAADQPVPVVGVAQAPAQELACETPLLAGETRERESSFTMKCLICSNLIRVTRTWQNSGVASVKTSEFRVAGNLASLINEAEEGTTKTENSFVAKNERFEAFSRNGTVTLTHGNQVNKSKAAQTLLAILKSNCN